MSTIVINETTNTIEITADPAPSIIELVALGPQGPAGEAGPAGAEGPQGPQGLQGPQGDIGIGVPTGGTTNQLLKKASNDDYDFVWATGGGGVSDWGDIGGTLANQTDLQAELDAKQDELVGDSDGQLFYRQSLGVIAGIPGWSVNSEFGLDIGLDYEADDLTGNFNIHNKNLSVKPQQASPDESITIENYNITIDPDDSGFAFGSTNRAAVFDNRNLNHTVSEADLGEIVFTSNYFDVGSGLATNVKGVSYSFGFGNFNANVNINGSLQGYGFQMQGHSTVTVGSSTFVTGFYDFNNFPGTTFNSYQSFVCGPIIGGIADGNGFTGYSCNPTIGNFLGNAGFTGFNLAPTIDTFDTGGFNGIYIRPDINDVEFATGIIVDMSQVTGTNVRAMDVIGDVSINGALTFTGALSIGQLNAFSSNAVINGGGVPSTIHGLITNPTVAANATIALADTIGVNTAMLLQIGDNAVVTSALVGISALALPAVVTMGSGSTVDQVAGATFALSLDAGGTGGTIANLDLCRSVAIPNGVTSVTRLVGYKMDLPFGDPGTTSWGIYVSPNINNYFQGNLLIGGTAVSDDTVTNSSVALEIKSTTKGLVLSRMTTTERNALTAINGMQIYNTTTDKFQGYAAGSWVDLH